MLASCPGKHSCIAQRLLEPKAVFSCSINENFLDVRRIQKGAVPMEAMRSPYPCYGSQADCEDSGSL